MSKKRRYEVWFPDEPFHMESISEKTLRMLIERKTKILRYKLIGGNL